MSKAPDDDDEPTHDKDTHGATTIRASKGGGAGKWLLGGLAAVVLAGGGYAAWKTFGPSQNSTDVAYNDQYAEEPLRAGALESDQDAVAESAATDESVAPPASTETRSTPPRRSRARAAAVPEETIGITPANVTTEETAVEDDSDIVVTAPPRPIWARTPSDRRLSALYPARALERGREGEARLHCTVVNGGALDCVRESETESSFGTAALRVSRTLRHAPQLADGSDATGTPVNLRVVFRIDDDTRRG